MMRDRIVVQMCSAGWQAAARHGLRSGQPSGCQHPSAGATSRRGRRHRDFAHACQTQAVEHRSSECVSHGCGVAGRARQACSTCRATAFGLRTVRNPRSAPVLNGERVRLTGLARHEDSPWEGLAETRGTMRHDYDDMKALHTTLSRPVHYPQNPYILDYADRHGILLIPEIPVWQFDEAQLSRSDSAGARAAADAGNDRAGRKPSEHICLERSQ